MNVNAISSVGISAVSGVTVNQAKVSNPFMMQNAVDTVELSAKNKTESKENKSVFAKAGEKFKSHISQGLDAVASEAETFDKPSQAFTVSHVAANTTLLKHVFLGVGSAVLEVVKGIVR